MIGLAVASLFQRGSLLATNIKCDSGPGETACVRINLAHTACTVQNFNVSTAGCAPNPGTPFVLKSPDTNNSSGEYYCITGSGCGTIGQSYWGNNGA